jgi:hypothetical protein
MRLEVQYSEEFPRKPNGSDDELAAPVVLASRQRSVVWTTLLPGSFCLHIDLLLGKFGQTLIRLALLL